MNFRTWFKDPGERAELRAEALRRGCTTSALMQQAWELARIKIHFLKPARNGK